jgi:hypothetical protein
MAWIKRNLYFVIFSVVAVALMGLAGYYLFSKWQLNNEMLEELNKRHSILEGLNNENPHPGSGDVNNIEAARKQEQQVRTLIAQARKNFQPAPAIPRGTNISNQEFTAALRHTIEQMQRDAQVTSVTVPPDYSFSFAAEKPRVTFALGSLEALAGQLGEVRAICDVLLQARINSLDGLRRERVSPDDAAGPVSDYTVTHSTTNELAVITPYEITFRCFSSELATVLSGFASSPYGFVVQSVNVEPGSGAPTEGNAPQAAAPGAVQVAGRGGLPTVLDERQLKISLVLNVVKLLPAK